MVSRTARWEGKRDAGVKRPDHDGSAGRAVSFGFFFFLFLPINQQRPKRYQKPHLEVSQVRGEEQPRALAAE